MPSDPVVPDIEVPPDVELRLLTFRLTCGTASSNTRLSMVTSPEPVTSADVDVVPFVILIET